MTQQMEKIKEKLNGPNNGGQTNTQTALTTQKKVSVPQTMNGLKTGQVKDIFSLYKAQIAQALPKHLTVDRVIQLATTMIARTPELAQCSTESLIGAVMQSSILGFEPVAALGQCYMVPFNNKKNGKKEVQFILGYKGMLELARRSNQLQTIYAQCVFSNDVFDYEFGLESKLVHKPAMEDRGELTHVYAVAKFINGGYAFEVMSRYDVDQIRKRSQAGSSNYSPWATDYPEMAKKTVIRRLFKVLPISIDPAVNTDTTVIKNDSFDKDGLIDLNRVESAEYEHVDTTTGEIIQETQSEAIQEEKAEVVPDPEVRQEETDYESPASIIAKMATFTDTKNYSQWLKEHKQALSMFSGAEAEMIAQAQKEVEAKLLKPGK